MEMDAVPISGTTSGSPVGIVAPFPPYLPQFKSSNRAVCGGMKPEEVLRYIGPEHE